MIVQFSLPKAQFQLLVDFLPKLRVLKFNLIKNV